MFSLLPHRRLRLGAGVLILAGTLLLLSLVGLTLAQEAGDLTRITTSPHPDRQSRHPSLSADGTKIAFFSDADFFNQGILLNQFEIWLYDTTPMTLTRVTTTTQAEADSFSPHLNADGTKLVFDSSADLLNQGIPPDQYEIWLYDTLAMTHTRLTTASDSSRGSFQPRINAGGTKIAFISEADLLNQGLPDNQYEIWLYDTATMTYTRITTASDSNRDSGFSRNMPALDLSAAGTRLVFASDSDFLQQGLPDDQIELWLYDTTTLTYTRLTTTAGDFRNFAPLDMSADGTTVAFVSCVEYIDQGVQKERRQLWLYDTQTMTYTPITPPSGPDRSFLDPSLNPDGTIVAFASDVDLLNEGNIPPGQAELWLYDTQTMTYTRLTTAAGSGFRGSETPSLNADSTRLAFSSNADFFDQGLGEFHYELWLIDILWGSNKLYFPMILKEK